jgi:hypothetical protein
MYKFLLKLAEKYGLLRVVITLVFGFIALFFVSWVIVHLIAEPGSNVTVLWGAYKYAKSKPDNSSVTHTTPRVEPTKQQQIPSELQKTSGEPAKIQDTEIIHGITEKTYGKAIKSLREKHNVRRLESLESGLSISETPRGTYFFVFYSFLNASGGKAVERFWSMKTDRLGGTYDFEIHLLKEGSPIVIGFTAENDAMRVVSPTPEIRKISLATEPWEKMTSLISLPMERIAKANARSIKHSEKESVYILDCEIK